MKTILVTIENPADGDLVIVEYSGPRGGNTFAKHTVVGARKRPVLDEQGFATKVEDVPAETPSDVAERLAAIINNPNAWMPEHFQARVNGESGKLVIHCSDEVADATFRAHTAGPGGTTVHIMVL